MSSAKLLTRWGIRGVIEASYAAGGSPTTTDGILSINTPEPNLEYLNDGTRGPSPLGGQLARGPMSGLGVELDLEMHCYTPGAAYSATVAPSVDRLLRASGFKRTTVLTGGAETHTYAPTTLLTELESLYLDVYRGGQKYPMSGLYGSFGISSEGPGFPLWTFGLKGIGTIPTDSVVPTDTVYPHVSTMKPQKSTSIVAAFGAFTNPIVRSFGFELNRELAPRANENSTGHQGYAPGNRDPKLTILIEAATLGSLGSGAMDPYTLADAGTEFAFSARHGVAGGTGQYKRWTLSLPKCTIANVSEVDDGPMAMWELELGVAITPGDPSNDISFLFD